MSVEKTDIEKAAPELFETVVLFRELLGEMRPIMSVIDSMTKDTQYVAHFTKLMKTVDLVLERAGGRYGKR